MDMIVDLTDDAAVDLSSHHGSTPTISQNGCTKSVDSPGKENLYENGIYANLTHSELIKVSCFNAFVIIPGLGCCGCMPACHQRIAGGGGGCRQSCIIIMFEIKYKSANLTLGTTL